MQTKEEVLIKQNCKCAICGWGGNKSIVNVHHIHPKSDGGSDMTDNQIVLCPNHHSVLSALISYDINPENLENIGLDSEEIRKLKILAKATTVFTVINNISTYCDEETNNAISNLYDSVVEEVKLLKEELL